MLSTAYSHIKALNKSADVRLYGQELMGQTHSIGLAEMLIKGQNADNFVQADTLKEDRFKDLKARYVLENPPFGTPWKGKDAKAGQEDAVLTEYEKGLKGRWGAGLPGGGDSQLLFMQSAIDKMDDKLGRAAIITNGSPLFTGNTGSGESQIRRWLLEEDLIEAIIAMPTSLFYNTGIATYIWILSKNKREERIGKIQLIDASEIYTTLRKSLGEKRREFSKTDRQKIVELYANFKENEYSQIHDNKNFIYKEYTVMQPLQRSYAINEERIENLRNSGVLNLFYDEVKHKELEELSEIGKNLKTKEKKKLKKYRENKIVFDEIFNKLNDNQSDKLYLSPEAFEPVLSKVLESVDIQKNIYKKIFDGLSEIDRKAEVQKDKKGKIIYDKETRDTELVNINENIEDYMEKEVLPHIPDAKAFFEENLNLKKPVIKTGAEIPFTRCFYKYKEPTPSEDLEKRFLKLEDSVNERVARLFEEVWHD